MCTKNLKNRTMSWEATRALKMARDQEKRIEELESILNRILFKIELLQDLNDPQIKEYKQRFIKVKD